MWLGCLFSCTLCGTALDEHTLDVWNLVEYNIFKVYSIWFISKETKMWPALLKNILWPSKFSGEGNLAVLHSVQLTFVAVCFCSFNPHFVLLLRAYWLQMLLFILVPIGNICLPSVFLEHWPFFRNCFPK